PRPPRSGPPSAPAPARAGAACTAATGPRRRAPCRGGHAGGAPPTPALLYPHICYTRRCRHPHPRRPSRGRRRGARPPPPPPPARAAPSGAPSARGGGAETAPRGLALGGPVGAVEDLAGQADDGAGRGVDGQGVVALVAAAVAVTDLAEALQRGDRGIVQLGG